MTCTAFLTAHPLQKPGVLEALRSRSSRTTNCFVLIAFRTAIQILRKDFGVGKPFVSALITVDSEKLGNYLEKAEIAIPADEEITQQDLVGKILEDEINTINAFFSNDPGNPRVKIEKFIIIAGQFSSATGEFTQMGKLRRGFVTEKYKKLVDAIYAGKEKVDAKSAAKFGLKTAIKVRKL